MWRHLATPFVCVAITLLLGAGTEVGASNSQSTAGSDIDVDTLLDEYPYLELFDAATLQACERPLHGACVPALNASASTLVVTWTSAYSYCFGLWCACRPGRVISTSSELRCTTTSVPSVSAICGGYRRCSPIFTQCIANFVYGPSLPTECAGFLSCAAEPAVAREDLRGCVASFSTTGLPCNFTPACVFARNVTSLANLIHDGALSNSDSGGGSSSSMNPSISLAVTVALAAMSLVVVLLYMMLRSHGAVRRAALENEAHLLPAQQLQRATVQEIPWFAWPDPMLPPEPLGGGAAVQMPPAARPPCAFCGREDAASVILPCCCGWCGCAPPDPTSGGKKRRKLSADKRPRACRCGVPVAEIANVTNLLPNSTPPPLTTDDQVSVSSDAGQCCVVCLDAPASVAFFPCGHRSTCVTCGKRIASGDAIATSTQVDHFLSGDQLAAECPLCRAAICFALAFPVGRPSRMRTPAAEVGLAAAAPHPREPQDLAAQMEREGSAPAAGQHPPRTSSLESL